VTYTAHTAADPPIQPEIPRSRFALGQADYPRDLEELRLGRFSDGLGTHPTEETHRGRFSEGQEALGDDDPEKHIRRRFSQGMETPPGRRPDERAGEGIAALGECPPWLGAFSDRSSR
jgi:hypothetical protein